MHRAIRLATVLIALCAPCFVLAQDRSGDCDRPGRVTLAGDRIPIRTALRSLADQTGYEVTISKSVRGYVSANFRCVDFYAAVRELVTQVGAAYCETERGVAVMDSREAPCERRGPVVEVVSHVTRGRSGTSASHDASRDSTGALSPGAL